MKMNSRDQQNSKPERDRLLREVPYGQLITSSPFLQSGLFNPYYESDSIWLHLSRQDPQLQSLKNENNCLWVVQDFLTLIPSYWVDPRYAGAATMYYRYAEFRCQAFLHEDEPRLEWVLKNLMTHHQPEKRYSEIQSGSEIYRASFQALIAVELKIGSTQTRWKLGQNRPIETRERIIENLRQKGNENSLRAAFEVERWIQSEKENER